jgi:hypothetical protein
MAARVWDESVECKDCGAKGGFKPGSMDFFYLHDELWNSFADTHDILCFDCAQTRLGRPITLIDLKDCAVTRCMLLGIRIANQSKGSS